MRSSTKSELQALRELGHFVLQQSRCFFCGFTIEARDLSTTFGHRRHGPILSKFTLHHLDENRENNELENLVLCHRLCHIAHHRRKRAEQNISGS